MDLAGILTVEQVSESVWRAWTPAGSQRSDIFGGQVAGQALRAAAQTVPEAHLPNSVHGYFLRRGQPDLPIDIHVERVRTGRTYTSRSVEACQEGKTIFTMLASFHLPEPGREYATAMPEVPPPEGLETDIAEAGWLPALEVRTVDTPSPLIRWWGRVAGPYPSDPAARASALLYASDLRAGGAAMEAIGYHFADGAPRDPSGTPVGNFGSLDHSLWFHRIPDVTEWFFCDVRPVTVSDSRGLVTGTMWDTSGRQLASFSQEMFLKVDAGAATS